MNEEEQKKQDELDEIEEKLLEEEAREREQAMIVSGRSVFEIKKMKDKPKHSEEDQNT